MNVLRIILVVLAGALSVGLTEVFGVLFLNIAPADLDLTANFFLAAALPAVVGVHLIMALLFWKAFEPNPVRNPLIFIASHAGLQSFELSFSNPPADVLAYVAIICVSGLIVTGVFRRYFWCDACARLGA